MTEISIKATRWSGGWELEIDDNHHTQSTTLATARQQVVDYLDTVWSDVDHSGWQVTIIPDISGLDEVEAARHATRDAAMLQEEAARMSRSAARKLRSEGLSVTDVAAVMGISRGRVSQLMG
ncbi:antitoxin HicB [Brooklawnia sp.]|uniref:antitoxin HicB n=1 Tax=Brooklawnia sp. TaxID=2699740 RepID=UPI00311D442F